MNFNEFLISFEKEIIEIKSAGKDPKESAIKIIEFCDSRLTLLKKHVLLNAFKSKEEEIHLFKHVKPTILFESLYYRNKLQYLIGFPVIDIDSQVNYILKHISNRKRFINKHFDLWAYLDSGNTNSDELFFLRENVMFSLYGKGNAKFMDSGFCTNKDIILAKLSAFKKFNNYLQREYYKVTNQSKNFPLDKELQQLEWTHSKSALVELIYALQCSNAINNGKAEIKQIASFFESTFNIELGDIYKTYSDIKYRQKSPTKFLEELTLNLRDEIDKNYR